MSGIKLPSTSPVQVSLNGFMRLQDVLQLIPVSKSTWWEYVRAGDFPQPVHLTERTTAWRVSDISKLIDRLSGGDTL